jgi:hypothetical protein
MMFSPSHRKSAHKVGLPGIDGRTGQLVSGGRPGAGLRCTDMAPNASPLDAEITIAFMIAPSELFASKEIVAR